MNKEKKRKKDGYDQIEEDLIQKAKAKEKKKEEMPVSGKSVFEIKRLKSQRSNWGFQSKANKNIRTKQKRITNYPDN